MEERVGFIGLGHLGCFLAASLVRLGRPVIVHDLDRSRADGLEASGAKWAESVAEVGEKCTVVHLCLPSPAVGRIVIAALIEAMPAGTTVIDMSTNDRETTLANGALLEANGIHLLEAPVTGGVHHRSGRRIASRVPALPSPTGSGRLANFVHGRVGQRIDHQGDHEHAGVH
jgi:3-hydroxyisobutyrate dehydrogenase